MKETPGDRTRELKNAGLKATTPRLRILELFQKRAAEPLARNRHLSAEEIHKVFESEDIDVGLATIYRVLTQFEQAGIITRHYFDQDRATYELQVTQHHDHLVCLRCKKVIEFIDPEIEVLQKKIAERYGYELCEHTMMLYGLCPACQREVKGKAAKA